MRRFRRALGWRKARTRDAAPSSADAVEDDRAQRLQLDYPGADIRISGATKTERRRARAPETEPWTVRWIEEWIAPGQCLYDIGANVGVFSLIAAKGPPRANVVAFEPSFSNFAALCENLWRNDLGGEVLALPLVLTDQTALTTLNYRNPGRGCARHKVGDRQPKILSFRQPVLGYRLDDLRSHFDLPQPNHIKLDVDGAEALVLGGGRNTVAADTLLTVLVEVHREESDAVGELLAEGGLARHTRTRGREWPVDGDPKFWYELWIRPGTHPDGRPRRNGSAGQD